MNRTLGLLAGLALCLTPAPTLAGQLLVENVRGATLDGAGQLHRFEALLVEDGKVVLTGTRAGLDKLVGPNTTRLDGGGRFLLPGLIDAHGHIDGLGRQRTLADLTGTTSLAEAQTRVRRYATAHPKDAWVVGRGWNETLWTSKMPPSAADLDAVVADRPAWLRRIDGHAGWANHAALKAAGIDRNSKDPVGGRIERDANGEPTGILVDAALDLLEKSIPTPSMAQRAAGLDAALAEVASVGLTSVGDAGIEVADLALFKRYADQGKLTARIYALAGDADFDALSANGPLLGYGNDHLTLRSVKLYADGALGSRGAALLAPYSDAPKVKGLLFEPAEALAKKMEKAFAKGFQVGVHGIGDAGNRAALDAFASAYKKHPQASALRNRIEHAQVVALEDIPRFRQLDIIASMQPTHATSDMNMAEKRVGPERIKGAYAWRRFLGQGTRIAGGSDFPVESTNPFFGIHAAVTRQDHAGKPVGGWYPDQAMTVTEALRAFTLDAAYAQHAEATQGTLEPGKWADFILVDQDIFAVAPSKLWQTKVLETWVGGKRVFRRQ